MLGFESATLGSLGGAGGLARDRWAQGLAEQIAHALSRGGAIAPLVPVFCGIDGEDRAVQLGCKGCKDSGALDVGEGRGRGEVKAELDSGVRGVDPLPAGPGCAAELFGEIRGRDDQSVGVARPGAHEHIIHALESATCREPVHRAVHGARSMCPTAPAPVILLPRLWRGAGVRVGSLRRRATERKARPAAGLACPCLPEPSCRRRINPSGAWATMHPWRAAPVDPVSLRGPAVMIVRCAVNAIGEGISAPLVNCGSRKVIATPSRAS